MAAAVEERLDDVERAAIAVAEARRELTLAIRAALANGASLRAVASYAGVSHEQIRRIAAGGSA